MDNLWNRGLDLLQVRWQMLAVMGVVSILLGTLAIGVSFAATLATVFILGCLVFAGGVVHLIQTLSTRGWAGFFGHLLATILYGIGGWNMIRHPAVTAASLTLVIGILLAVGGLYQIVTSLVMRYRSWGWALFQGLLGVACGALIY